MVCGWKDKVPTWDAFDWGVEMDDILVKDPKFDKTTNIEKSSYIIGVDQSGGAESSWRCEWLLYYGQLC